MDRQPSISTHVLDTERGEPARGVPVTLSRWDEGRLIRIAEHRTNEDGRIADLVGGPLQAGSYRIDFDVAAYFRAQERDPTFFTNVAIEFNVVDAARHHHVPLLVSRYSCASYRGS